MKPITDISVTEILPEPEDILISLGMPAGAEVHPKTAALLDRATDLFITLAEPKAVMADIAVDEFEPVYLGSGRNESPAPIETIYPGAEALALFALTVGDPVCRKIMALLDSNDFALGTVLDTAASEGADRLSQVLEHRFADSLATTSPGAADRRVLAYSPGYCGWHISAQRQLFDIVHPENIGITLRESFLMEPLKSISGVLIAAPRSLHVFDNTYPFCSACRSQPCRARMEKI